MYLPFCRSSSSGFFTITWCFSANQRQKKCLSQRRSIDPGPGLSSSRGICNRRTVAAESRGSRSRWLQNMNVWRLSTSPSLLTRPFFGCLDPSSSQSRPKRRNGFSRSGNLKRGQVSPFTNKKCLCPNFLKKRLTRLSFTGLGFRTERARQWTNHKIRRQKEGPKESRRERPKRSYRRRSVCDDDDDDDGDDGWWMMDDGLMDDWWWMMDDDDDGDDGWWMMDDGLMDDWWWMMDDGWWWCCCWWWWVPYIHSLMHISGHWRFAPGLALEWQSWKQRQGNLAGLGMLPNHLCFYWFLTCRVQDPVLYPARQTLPMRKNHISKMKGRLSAPHSMSLDLWQHDQKFMKTNVYMTVLKFHSNFCTQMPLQRAVFTHKTFTHKRFCTEAFTRPRAALRTFHRAALTHRNFYAQEFLHTEVFTLSSFYTKQAAFTTQMILHTKACTKRNLYIYLYIHRAAFTQRGFYTRKLLQTVSFVQHNLRRVFLADIQQNLHLHPTPAISGEGCLVTNKIRMSVTTHLDTDPDARNLRRGDKLKIRMSPRIWTSDAHNLPTELLRAKPNPHVTTRLEFGHRTDTNSAKGCAHKQNFLFTARLDVRRARYLRKGFYATMRDLQFYHSLVQPACAMPA